jgi:proteasome lid subunit RPN8/RPN11
MEVLGDVHTHPGPDSSQSETDRMHPMISEAGHVAVILPNYAKGWAFHFVTATVYEYEGNYRWRDWSGEARTKRLRFAWW